MVLKWIYIITMLDYLYMSFAAKHSEALEIISNCFHNKVELDTVAYNTFLKAMLEAGLYSLSLSLAVKFFSYLLC